uniref:BCL2 like 13 n=1 Tax=Sus scrofa TaxID=9823 RepID=A0A8D0NEW2_PIG
GIGGNPKISAETLLLCGALLPHPQGPASPAPQLPTPPPESTFFPAVDSRLASGTTERWSGQERVALPSHVCAKKPPSLSGQYFLSGVRIRPLAARPAPRPDASGDGSTLGDVTRQHGGGGRLGLWVGAAASTTAEGFCREQPLPPPRLSPFLGQGPGPGVQQDIASQPLDPEVLLKVKTEIEEELKSLDKEISEAFTSTGFDRHTSPVFSPANPESSVEDCLAHLGEKASQELKVPLLGALQVLLSRPVTYQAYRECTLETTVHASGWNKGTVFNLESEDEECPAGTAEDSNDIYILPSDSSAHVSPPESPTAAASWQAESLPVSLSASQSWHTESMPVSLGPESWQQVTVDPEEVKSLDSNGAGEKSENNSSNSDIVHVEKEEIPEGVEEAAMAARALPAGELPEVAPGAREPSLPRITAPSLTEAMGPDVEVTAIERVSPTTSLFVELGEEEAEAEPADLEQVGGPVLEPPAPLTSQEGVDGRGRGLRAGPPVASDQKAGLPYEGKSILLFGGAAAVAILAVAVGVALALRRK